MYPLLVQRALLGLLWAAAISCGRPDSAPLDAGARADAGPSDGTALCAGSYGPLEEWGPLADVDVREASGLVAARRSPGVLFTHNDSGDSARIFAVAADGRALARIALPGVTAVDFEDIAAGSCPDSAAPCLYIADTGNNLLDRAEVAVYVIPEPELRADQAFVELDAPSVMRIPVAFAADIVDMEAMMVDAAGENLYLFEKNNLDRARLMRISGPFADGRVETLEPIAEFDAPGLAVDYGRAITGADLHVTGTRVAVRVYTGVYEYRLAAGQGLADFAALERVLAVAGPLLEPQGEAVAYDHTGAGLITVSEDPEAMPGQVLHHYSCRP